MRKALIAAIVAAALFAVGAFAADFTLNTEDVASGEADVLACATEVDVDWTTDPVVGTDGEFMATGADLTFTEDPTGACEGQAATIAVGLDNDGDATDDDVSDEYAEFSCGLIDAAGEATCSFGSTPLMVSEIEDVSVLAEGVRI